MFGNRRNAENAELTERVQELEAQLIAVQEYAPYSEMVRQKVGELSLSYQGDDGDELEEIVAAAVELTTDDEHKKLVQNAYDTLPSVARWEALLLYCAEGDDAQLLRDVINQSKAAELAHANRYQRYGKLLTDAQENGRVDVAKIPSDVEIIIGLFPSKWNLRKDALTPDSKVLARCVTARTTDNAVLRIMNDEYNPYKFGDMPMSYSGEDWRKTELHNYDYVRFGSETVGPKHSDRSPILYQGQTVYQLRDGDFKKLPLDLGFLIVDGINLFDPANKPTD
jgi:hypothetical protein